GAIADAYCYGSVHHELYVTRAAGFKAVRLDLFRDVTGGNQPLREADVVLGQEQDLETATDRRVSVNDAGHVADQLDDKLSQPVGRRRLASKEAGARRHLQRGMVAQPVIEHDDVQEVEQLALVLMNAFDLAVEERVWVDALSARRIQPVG